MQIVNPLYDKAFKYLMQNNRIAKKVLSVILDQEVLKLKLSQQETVVPDEKRGLTLFRLDFKAEIRDADGKTQTVLIELQKSKFDTDIRRFRNYLGSNYIEPQKTENNKEEGIYPLITVYILGYEIKDIPYMAVTVNRKIVNSVNHKPVEVDSFFINHLTHRSHILQVKRLPKQRKTKLEQFLTFFNQAWCTDKKYILDLLEIPEGFKDIATHLQKPVVDETFRRQLEGEEEIDQIFEQQEAKYLKRIEEAEKQKEEAEKQAEQDRKQKEEAEKQAEQDRKQKEEAEKQAEQDRKQKEDLNNRLKQSIIRRHKKGAPVEELAEDYGMAVEEIQKILRD